VPCSNEKRSWSAIQVERLPDLKESVY